MKRQHRSGAPAARVGVGAMLAVVALLAVGCGEEEASRPPGGSQPAPFARLQRASSELKQYLRERDYWVGDGQYWFLLDEHCAAMILATGRCFGTNPGSPYGMILLPDPPAEFAYTPGLDWDDFYQRIGRDDLKGLRSVWRVRQDEAIVLFVVTPPNARYFGFANTILFNFAYTSATLFTDADVPVNNAVIAGKPPTRDPFNQPLVFIVTPDNGIADTITERLRQGGFDQRNIFVQRIPAEPHVPLAVGYGPAAALFNYEARVAYMEGNQEYLERPPAIVYRVMPNTATASSDTTPFVHRPQPPLETGTTEDFLSRSLQALAEAVQHSQRAASRRVELAPLSKLTRRYEQCITNNVACLGTLDANYNYSLPRQMGTTEDDFTFVVGVNHATAGKATYASITIYSRGYGAPLASFSDRAMAGSVAPYLAYVSAADRGEVEENADRLYVLRFARSCASGDAFCAAIPSSGDLSQGEIALAPTDSYHFFERAYLNPAGLHGPAASELLAPIAVVSVSR